MKIRLLSVSQSKEAFYLEACRLYAKKINHYIPFEIETLKPKGVERAQAKLKTAKESEEILRRIGPKDYVILFDENGKRMDSVKFSGELTRLFETGQSQLCFVIGGAFGVGPEVKSRAQLTLNLSPFVLNHLVAGVVALEQIYRAMTIWRGIPYHNE